MKNIVKLAVVIFAVGILSNNLFAQQSQNGDTGTQWVDANGDGICDNFGTDLQGSNRQNSKMNKGARKGTGEGLGTGMGNGYGDGTGVRPQDGSGFGRKSGDGTGTTSSGRKGSGRRGGNK